MSNPNYGSSRDPRRWVEYANDRQRAIKHVSKPLSFVCDTMPEDVRQRVLINRRIEQVHDQFAQVVDPFILEHTNSVCLLPHKDPFQDSKASRSAMAPTIYDLKVFLDNSTCAAELNARRELIRLEYLKRFGVHIDVFEIKISRGSYKDKHPFSRHLHKNEAYPTHTLSQEEMQHIEDICSALPKGAVRDSFIKAMKAQKQRPQGSE